MDQSLKARGPLCQQKRPLGQPLHTNSKLAHTQLRPNRLPAFTMRDLTFSSLSYASVLARRSCDCRQARKCALTGCPV
jgi:hypothetical protein